LYLYGIMSNEPMIVGLFGASHYTVQGGNSRFTEERVVLFDGKQLLPYESLKVDSMSFSFDWGNSGTGSRQLALAILLRITDKSEALALMDAFVREFIARLPSHKGFFVPIDKIQEWMSNRRDNKMFQVFEVAKIIEKNDRRMNDLAAGVLPADKPEEKPTMSKSKSKYPIEEMLPGESFFTDDKKVYKRITVAIAHLIMRSEFKNRQYACRTVSMEWVKEQEDKLGVKLNLPSGGYGVWRLK
jgi:hypothetical protein